jgi:hypothetical protein
MTKPLPITMAIEIKEKLLPRAESMIKYQNYVNDVIQRDGGNSITQFVNACVEKVNTGSETDTPHAFVGFFTIISMALNEYFQLVKESGTEPFWIKMVSIYPKINQFLITDHRKMYDLYMKITTPSMIPMPGPLPKPGQSKRTIVNLQQLRNKRSRQGDGGMGA